MTSGRFNRTYSSGNTKEIRIWRSIVRLEYMIQSRRLSGSFSGIVTRGQTTAEGDSRMSRRAHNVF